MSPYLVPAATVSFEEEIKKSRFITLLARVEGVEAAKQFVEQVKKDHPSARHHCWAFVAGSPADSQQLGFSDDGEPSGTAGKPILAQLMGSQIGEICAVVIRYYGGIRLGTGGLVRAYGGGVQQALKLIETVRIVPKRSFTLRCDYNQLTFIEKLLSECEGVIDSQQYGEFIDLVLSLPDSELPLFTQKLNDLSRGTLQLSAISQ